MISVFDHPTLNGLNDQQRHALLNSFQRHTMAIAGAGAGKTKVKTQRIAFLLADKREIKDFTLPPLMIAEGESPGSILLFTFTNKAAKEMKHRTALLVGEEIANKVWAGTFHSICVRLLKMYPDEAGLPSKNFTILDTDDQKAILKDILKTQLVGADNPDTKLVSSTLDQISSWKNDLKSPAIAEMEMAHGMDTTAVKCYYSYQEKLTRDNSLDFDDIIFKTVKALQIPDGQMKRYCHNRFRWISVDEFQDTNEAQYQLIKGIASPWTNIFCVGDDKQGIYGWRGAEIKNVKRFVEEFNANLMILTYNYRSKGKIVRAANALIANNPNQIPMQAEAVNDDGDNLKVHSSRTDKTEAQFIAEEVKNLTEFGGYKLSKIAVLVRNWHLTRELEQALMRFHIPYEVVNGIKFFERRLIKDSIAGLIIMVNPASSAAAKRVTGRAGTGIGTTTIESIEELSQKQRLPFFHAMAQWTQHQTPAKAGKVAPFMAIWSQTWKDFSILSSAKITDVLERVWKNMEIGQITKEGLFVEGDYVKKISKTAEELENNVRNLKEFYGMAKQFQEKATENTIHDFLDSLALVSQTDQDTKQDAVQILTFHASKGLEWDVVFLLALEEGLFPGARDRAMQEAIEEERRLAYVGVTRGREQVYITHANERYYFNKVMYNPPSRFIDEIPYVLKESV